MKIYYDGNNPKKYLHIVEGFTTNTSFASQSEHNNYIKYIKDYLDIANGAVCSFQIWSDNNDQIIQQSQQINSMGKNIFVKIPIIKCNGNNNIEIIKKVLDMGINVNITAIHTINQINLISNLLSCNNNIIISVFAGGITDCGLDPVPIIKYAVDRYQDNKNLEILWAGCQTNLHINQAKESGCHIITIPDAIMNKMYRMGIDLENTSINKVKKFMEDANLMQKGFGDGE
jgi:transaldolase